MSAPTSRRFPSRLQVRSIYASAVLTALLGGCAPGGTSDGSPDGGSGGGGAGGGGWVHCPPLARVDGAPKGKVQQHVRISSLADAARYQDVTEIDGELQISSGLDEPESNVLRCLELPKLTRVTRRIEYLETSGEGGNTLTQSPEIISFPSLVSAGAVIMNGDAERQGAVPLREAYFGALEEIRSGDPVPMAISVTLHARKLPRLERLEAPALRTIGGQLLIVGNPVLATVKLPALTKVAAEVNSHNSEIQDNPGYCNSEALALRAQVNETDFHFAVRNNKDCP